MDESIGMIEFHRGVTRGPSRWNVRRGISTCLEALRSSIVVVCSLLCLPLVAEPGQLDTTFNVGTGAMGIKKMDVAPNGRIAIVGTFTQFDGTARNGLVQINSDGSLDTGFIGQWVG